MSSTESLSELDHELHGAGKFRPARHSEDFVEGSLVAHAEEQSISNDRLSDFRCHA